MEFLKDFTKRMQSVGRYAVLMNNSFQKTTWKQYGIETMDGQITMLFTVLLFLMEASLKEEICTLDDIGELIAEVDARYFRRGYSMEDSRELADFIVNVILGNSGSAMYFKGYNYERGAYEDLTVSYIANRVVYLDNGIRRTSYYLTDEGYNLMLSTMELENNLKLTVHEMLFRLHLDKADYGRAVHDIKNVFEQLRIQNQKIQEAMRRIRQNALSYSVEEYRRIIEENIDTVEKTRQEFGVHREVVERRVKEFEEQDIHISALSDKDKENLENLRIIEGYLNRSLDEHQRILNQHFDLKTLYDAELEHYANMTMVQRFHFRTELYDRLLEDSSLLVHSERLLQSLFWHRPDKIYNPGLAFEEQRRLRKEALEDEAVELGFDEELYREEKEQKIRERLAKYEGSLTLLLRCLASRGSLTLSWLREAVFPEQGETLIPSLEIFREIMIELLTAGRIRVEELRRERREYLAETPESFQLNEMLLAILEEQGMAGIRTIYARRAEAGGQVCFGPVKDEAGNVRSIRCSDVELWYED